MFKADKTYVFAVCLRNVFVNQPATNSETTWRLMDIEDNLSNSEAALQLSRWLGSGHPDMNPTVNRQGSCLNMFELLRLLLTFLILTNMSTTERYHATTRSWSVRVCYFDSDTYMFFKICVGIQKDT